MNRSGRKLRILFLLRSSIFNRFGGAELQADYISKLCEKSGYEVHYAFDSNENLQILNRKVHYHFLHDYGSKFFSWLNFFSIKKLIGKISPHLVYQRVRCAYTGIAAYYAKKNSLKIVYHLSSEKNCRKNKIPVDWRFLPNLVNEYLGRYGIKNADLIIAQTQAQQKALRFNFNRDSILIPNGLHLPLPPLKKTDPPIVVWIANIKRWKQPEIFIELAKELQDSNAQFIYAGRPSEVSYQIMLIKKVKKLPNLRYLGEIPFKASNELLSKASIFVNTSQPREGFPNTYIQAWMRETPVVALNCDPDGVIKKYKIGYHSKSFEQLVEDVKYLIENGDVRREMGKKARRYAENNHDIDKIANRYLEAFRRILN